MTLARRHLLAISAASAFAGACSQPSNRSSAPPMPDAAELSRRARALSARARPGLLDIGATDIASGRVWYSDETGHYPMAGISKLPVAAAALALVDQGRLRLNQKVRLADEDVSPPPSRINRLFADGRRTIDTPLADLIGLAIQHDDSTAGDMVLRLAGGPRAVTDWLGARGVAGVRIDRYDREWIPEAFGLHEFRSEWREPSAFADAIEHVAPGVRQTAMDAYLADPRDTATAPGFIALMDRLAKGTLIGADSTRFLTNLMQAHEDVGFAHGLPTGTALQAVGGATPTSLGFTPADTAAGLVQLAGGRRVALVVFLAGSTATARARRLLMGEAARLVAADAAKA
jgi:beta-lactamase class A